MNNGNSKNAEDLIPHLPNEILDYIHRVIANIEDQSNFSVLSKKFYEIAKPTLYKQLILLFPSQRKLINEEINKGKRINFKRLFKQFSNYAYEKLNPRQRSLITTIKNNKVPNDVTLEDIFSIKDKQNINLLEWACRIKNQSALNFIYKLALSEINESSKSPLGSEVLNTDKNNLTLIHWAFYCNQPIEYIENLILPLRNKDTELNKHSPAGTPFFIAVRCGHAKLVEFLKQKDIDADKPLENNGTPPLYIAVEKGHADVVELLLKHHADMDQALEDGTTPLYVAARSGHADVVELLLKHHADVDKALEDGTTPLYIATRSGHADVVELLLKHHADVDNSYHQRETPLQAAVRNGLKEIELMIRKAIINTRLTKFIMHQPNKSRFFANDENDAAIALQKVLTGKVSANILNEHKKALNKGTLADLYNSMRKHGLLEDLNEKERLSRPK